jgi:hypothetical protein
MELLNSEFIANAKRYLALRPELVISEMDVRLCTGTTLEQQTQQRDRERGACPQGIAIPEPILRGSAAASSEPGSPATI